ncbi:MAG: hypothetical protein C4576_27430 [Desulfobacteraceae bacterium]|nr:MAG: hypothetical protein C4576_27430 [Desulfobacteraceae bacterium]
MENEFPQFTGLMETVLRYSVADSIPVGYAELGVKPWLDLLDKNSYSLKLSLPLTWGPSFYKWHDDEGQFLGAGLFASLQLKTLPPRYGQWTLNTGFFYVRKELSAFNQEYSAHADNVGGIGAINISITY